MRHQWFLSNVLVKLSTSSEMVYRSLRTMLEAGKILLECLLFWWTYCMLLNEHYLLDVTDLQLSLRPVWKPVVLICSYLIINAWKYTSYFLLVILLVGNVHAFCRCHWPASRLGTWSSTQIKTAHCANSGWDKEGILPRTSLSSFMLMAWWGCSYK